MVRIVANVVGRPQLRVSLPPKDVHYLTQVMRRRPGDLVEVLGADGRVWVGEWMGEGVICLKALSLPPWVPPRSIILYQSLLKGDHFSEVVDQATQVGVTRIVPVLAERCVVRAVSQNRRARWQAIAKEASEQCRRAQVPELGELLDLEEMRAVPGGESYALAPQATPGYPWRQQNNAPVELVVGPEGGLSPLEIAQLQRRGFHPLSLGPQIFRSENAGAFAALLFLQ